MAVNSRSVLFRLFVTACSFLILALSIFAQKAKDDWLRVSTGDDLIIDVNRNSLIFERENVFRALFRTLLTNSETVAGKSGLTYQTRLDQIEFDVRKSEYRVFESEFVDSKGTRVFFQKITDESGWKPMQGSSAYRLRRAAEQLPPFGTWKVLSYRYASGEAPQSNDPTELVSLVGTNLTLSIGNVRISTKTCASPVFAPRTITKDEFLRRFGSPLEAWNIEAPRIDALILGCEVVFDVPLYEPTLKPKLKEKTDVVKPPAEDPVRKRASPRDFPEQTLILLLDGGRALMLWDGVFFELQRPGDPFVP